MNVILEGLMMVRHIFFILFAMSLIDAPTNKTFANESYKEYVVEAQKVGEAIFFGLVDGEMHTLQTEGPLLVQQQQQTQVSRAARRSAQHCASFKQHSSGSWRVINVCNGKVKARWYSGKGGWGCTPSQSRPYPCVTELKPYSEQSITKPGTGASIIACFSPSFPTPTGGGRFSCP